MADFWDLLNTLKTIADINNMLITEIEENMQTAMINIIFLKFLGYKTPQGQK